MRRLAVIPARGGSKRIPHKNIVDFEGRPLLAWTVDAAAESGLFERIVVSTEDPSVVRVAEAAGADVPFLRELYVDDESPVSLATTEVVERLDRTGETYDAVAQLFAVCPLRNADDIVDAVEAFEARDAPFQVSCARFMGHPFWAVTLDAQGVPHPLFPEAGRKRSQDLPKLFSATGATWLARPQALLAERTFYGRGHVYHPMPWQRAIDIDDEDDLELARALKNLPSRGSAS